MKLRNEEVIKIKGPILLIRFGLRNLRLDSIKLIIKKIEKKKYLKFID